MIRWLRSAGEAQQGTRKLTGLVYALGTTAGIGLGSVLLLVGLAAYDTQAAVAVSATVATIAGIAIGAVGTLYGAFVGGNASEHKHRGKDAPEGDEAPANGTVEPDAPGAEA